MTNKIEIALKLIKSDKNSLDHHKAKHPLQIKEKYSEKKKISSANKPDF